MPPYRRGEVVWHPAPFREGGRPFVVLSDEDHPFYGEEYVVAGVTTSERNGAVELTGGGWLEGGAPRQSWVSPWYLLTVKDANITGRLGLLAPEVMDMIAEEVAHLIGFEK